MYKSLYHNNDNFSRIDDKNFSSPRANLALKQHRRKEPNMKQTLTKTRLSMTLLVVCFVLMLGIVFASPTFAAYAAGEDGTAPTIVKTGGIDVDRKNHMGTLPNALKGGRTTLFPKRIMSSMFEFAVIVLTTMRGSVSSARAVSTGFASTMTSISTKHVASPKISVNIFDLFAFVCVIIFSPCLDFWGIFCIKRDFTSQICCIKSFSIR